jgi:hypothetical protein
MQIGDKISTSTAVTVAWLSTIPKTKMPAVPLKTSGPCHPLEKTARHLLF